MCPPTNTPSSSPSSNDKPIGITQIHAYIPIELDLTKMNYNVWRELFETHYLTLSVQGHLDCSSKPTPESEKTWKEHNGLVKMWIYETVSEQILNTILKAKATPYDIWVTFKNLFCNNNEARAMQHENELRSLLISDLSVHDYCHKIKTLSDLHANLNSPVSDRLLVMHMLNGLSEKYDSILNVIQHQTPFSSFTKARLMLLMGEPRLFKQVKPVPQVPESTSPSAVMYSSLNQQSDPKQQHQSYGNNHNNHGRGHGGRKNRDRDRNYNNNYGSGSYAYLPWSYGSPWQYPPSYSVPPSYHGPSSYASPPSYYHAPAPPPSSSHSTTTLATSTTFNRRLHRPVRNSSNSYISYALITAFNTISIQDPSKHTWYMDTCATNHIAT
ncbi:hypothetical protein EUTSA_v10001107mg [Eutrema salsugineum]|uniref:Retrotransposon Copia-like N-terminal domain-containing protein n=1 Tax=Eutrema salsugineum TaxID=72664 RepID=V4N313_EUTSA|nr:hypothetical protein EUTSA_v10001107mg [Eutrema salsugineum]